MARQRRRKDTATAPPGRSRHRRGVALAIGSLVVVVAAAGALFGALHGGGGSIPSFASLADHPDATLQGTVAYYESSRGCIRLVAAAGQPSRSLWCLPAEGPATWVKVGKPVGPQLVWLPDGRLQVTLFRMKVEPQAKQGYPGLTRGWQKVIDVHTGAVQDVPLAEVPSAPDTTTEPAVTPTGERVSYTFDPSTGRAEVTLTTSARTRTLLSVHGPGEYTYQFGPVFWAPNWQWLAAADDGRILILTPGDPPVTRVLVTGSGGGAGGGTAGPTFAVTAANLLTPPKTAP